MLYIAPPLLAVLPLKVTLLKIGLESLLKQMLYIAPPLPPSLPTKVTLLRLGALIAVVPRAWVIIAPPVLLVFPLKITLFKVGLLVDGGMAPPKAKFLIAPPPDVAMLLANVTKFRMGLLVPLVLALLTTAPPYPLAVLFLKMTLV